MQSSRRGFGPEPGHIPFCFYDLAKALQIDLGQAQSAEIRLVFTPINKRDQKNIGGDNGAVI